MRIVIYHKENPSYFLSDIDKFPMSGSNTAVLHMTRALLKKGNQVVLIRDGNEITRLKKKADVFVISKNPVIAYLFFSKAKKTFLWVHNYIDQPSFLPLYNPKFRKNFLLRINGILCLSRFQMRSIKKEFDIPPKFLKLTRNGVDLSLFKEIHLKRPPVCIYASHPARGLKLLLKIWPMIKERVPEAKLKIFSPREIYTSLFKETKNLNGVIWIKPLAQPKLAEEYLNSKLLLYPTDSSEISCLVAIEARAAGMAIITSPIAGLKETARGNIFIQAPYGSRDYVRQFVEKAIWLLKDESAWEKFSKANLESRQQYSWDIIANEWLKIFKSHE